MRKGKAAFIIPTGLHPSRERLIGGMIASKLEWAGGVERAAPSPDRNPLHYFPWGTLKAQASSLGVRAGGLGGGMPQTCVRVDGDAGCAGSRAARGRSGPRIQLYEPSEGGPLNMSCTVIPVVFAVYVCPGFSEL